MSFASGGKSNGPKSEINITPLVDVVLVLLIIFLVTMPIMMKQVTLEVPRKADTNIEDVSSMGKQATLLVRPDGTITLSDGEKDLPIQMTDLAGALRPFFDGKTTTKMVFVDYCDPVPWTQVVSTMDTIRSMAADKDHDEIKVALKMRDKDASGNPRVDDVGCPLPPAQQ